MSSKTGGIFNDDNKYNKSGIIGYNGTSNDDDYYPPAEPKKKGNTTGSSKKGNSKAGVWGAIIVLAIIIFIVLHAVNTYYNMQDLEYFDNRVKEAQERVDQLEAQGYGPSSTNMVLFTKAYGQEEQQEFFIITDKEIEVMNKATEILHAMNDFDEWCTNNFETHAPQCYYVFEEFLIDNGGIISQIDKVINN